MRLFKQFFLKIVGLLVALFFSFSGFSQVPGIDPVADVREVTDMNFDGLPKVNFNINNLLNKLNNAQQHGHPKFKLFIGSEMITEEPLNGIRVYL